MERSNSSDSSKKIQYLSILLIVCAFASAIFMNTNTEEVYEGTAKGFHGDIHVQVAAHRNDENAIEITDIQVKHEDTPDIGGVAISDLVEKVKAEQSVEVEMVAGASYSSQGFLEAVKEAVAKVPEK